MNSILSHAESPLTAPAELELVRAFLAGDTSAGDRLVRSHSRFVFKVASSFRSRSVPVDDLFQEGLLGFLEGLRRFDPDHGVRLMSYAVHWVRARIQAYLMAQHSVVRLGTSQVQRRLYYGLRREEKRLYEEDGTVATDEELAEHFGVSAASVQRMRLRLHRADASLDAPLAGRDSGVTLGARISDMSLSPEDQVSDAQVQSVLSDRLPELLEERLDDRERYILDLRIFNDEPWTLERIGRSLGITRERTRQLEARAKGKLKGELADLVDPYEGLSSSPNTCENR